MSKAPEIDEAPEEQNPFFLREDGSATRTDRFRARWLLGAVGLAAISGIVYELLLATTASFLLGDSVREWSLTIGVYLAAMGLGSYATRYVRDESLLRSLIALEVSVALIGGFSTMILLSTFAWVEPIFRPTFFLIVGIVGMLVGLEIPLLTRALKPYGDLKSTLSEVFGLDYGGALIASVVYPLFLYPLLGVVRTALAVSLVNILGALMILRASQTRTKGSTTAIVTAILILGAGLAVSSLATERIDAAVYAPERVAYQDRSPYQRITLTRRPSGSTQLYLNGHLQFSTSDEARYHEPLVHGSVALLGREPEQVLILGGGDGIAIRELLHYDSVRSIRLVDLDPQVVALARSHPMLTNVNQGAFDDPRVEVRHEDALGFLRQDDHLYDLILVDLPDPSTPGLARLYTRQFYARVKDRLRQDGLFTTQAGSPYHATAAFWCIAESVEDAGLEVRPFHANVPSFGEWGFVAAAQRSLPDASTLTLLHQGSFLTESELAAMFRFPSDMQRPQSTEAHTLLHPQLPALFNEGWRRSR